MKSGISGDLFCEGFDASAPIHCETHHEKRVCGLRVIFGEADAAHARGGKYATVICGRLWDTPVDGSLTEAITDVLAHFVSAALSSPPERILVCALGNTAVTADSLGTAAADKILAGNIRGKQVFVVKTGTPASTGITSSETAAMFASFTKAELVICIDSLAATTPERLGSVIQITDCGISPGSGISAHSTAISKTTLGIPVLSIGIPTVIRGDGGVLYTCAMADELIRRGSAVIAGGINGYAVK